MPKVKKSLLDEATNKAVGGMFYRQKDVAKWKEVRRLTGITKGQWKRFQHALRDTGYPPIKDRFVLNTSELAIKKLEVMAKHGGSEHLETLLKMVEAQAETDHEL